MVSESLPQTNYSELRSWTLWTCAPSAHSKTVFHQPSRCSLQVHFRVDNFLLSGQNVTCTRVSFCNLIGTAKTRRRKSTTFTADVTRLSLVPRLLEPGYEANHALSSPLVFEERAWGRSYCSLFLIRGNSLSFIEKVSQGLVARFNREKSTIEVVTEFLCSKDIASPSFSS